MRLQEHGIVLPIAIMMTGIMTLLTLSILQSIVLFSSLSHNALKKQDELYQLESTALLIADELIKQASSDCIVKEVDPNQTIEMLMNNQGCSFINNHRTYDYLIDDLGIYPCLKIASNHTIYSSHHWRISVGVFSLKYFILQLRVVMPEKDVVCGLKEEHQIKEGVISWRHLKN